MLDNCRYNNIKILHELSKLAWFIDKHCTQSKYGCKHESCQTLHELKNTLEQYIEQLNKQI
ncbi:hypothetical protein GF322_05195 [Candidatus Dependentiae bacterium]|nr:hypothetical protein [Candidatus Dependentiae bacterium]